MTDTAQKRDCAVSDPRRGGHDYQVIVVGGGAAGLMAAGQAAEQGAKTLILEKMKTPGRKLGITGKGRCNLTNVASLPEFLYHFGENGRFLRQAFSRFFTADLVAFFGQLGVPTETERGGRVFPASGRAQDVVAALVRWVRRVGVTVVTEAAVERVIVHGDRVAGVQVVPVSCRRGECGGRDESGSRIYSGAAVILATGGASYPATGSTGDGYRLARAMGHAIVPIRPALVPLETAGDLAPRLQGLNLRNVRVRLRLNGKRVTEVFGEMLFTHFGVSGPIILTLSKRAVDGLRQGQAVTISLDLKPALDERKLDERLLRDLRSHGKQRLRTVLKGLLPQTLIPVCLELTGISPDRLASELTVYERRRLRAWLKDFRLEVTGYRPFAEAIITAGGVDTREVAPRTMASRLVQGLYLVGEVLDIDGDTGGYNLQAAFSTGWVAGRAAAEWVVCGRGVSSTRSHSRSIDSIE
jgi:predicted Rossmann fold flavoprotein